MIYDDRIDKRQVRTSFGRAASGYDRAAALQRKVCDKMLSRLNYIKCTPNIILDAGSGTGYGTRKLMTRYATASVLAVDIASAMHFQARSTISYWKQLSVMPYNPVAYVIGDMENMPFNNSCVELIWSNLALQWCNDIKQTFAEAHRVLQPAGLFMFSTFGPNTLKELRQAFRHIDNYSHVNRFIDTRDISDILIQNGFAAPVMDVEYITVAYDDVITVMRDLKAIGAHNVTKGRRRGLTGKAAWQKAINYYETLRIEEKIPATFEVVYGHAWKESNSHT